MSGEDDSIGTTLGKVLNNTQAFKKAEKSMTNQQMTSFANIIAESFVRAQKAVASPTLTPPQKLPQALGVTGLTLSSGLDVLHVPLSGTQKMNAGILLKHNCGDTESACLKQRRTVIVALPNTMVYNNVLSLISSDDIDKHDLAADCQE